jgi:hypothetical protein
MGTTQSKSHKPNPQKIYIVIDLYLKSLFDVKMNIDDLKTNDFLKKKLKVIILTALVTKGNYNVSLDDTNLWLVSKTDKNGVQYLELNAVADFYESNFCEIYDNVKRMKKMKLHILSEFYTYTSTQCNIVIPPDTTLVLLYNTLYNIAVYSN